MLYGDKSCFSPIILPALKRICRLNQGLLLQTAFFQKHSQPKGYTVIHNERAVCGFVGFKSAYNCICGTYPMVCFHILDYIQ